MTQPAYDENAEVLERMAARGNNLSVPRLVDFNLVFADEISAQAFADAVTEMGFSVSLEETSCVADLPWDVTATGEMALDVDKITNTEQSLDELAKQFGGRVDGWGCFSVK